MTLDLIWKVLGWALAINMGIYALTAVSMLTLRDWMSNYHARYFDIEPAEVRRLYMQALTLHKLVIVNFVFVPWLVVWIIR